MSGAAGHEKEQQTTYFKVVKVKVQYDVHDMTLVNSSMVSPMLRTSFCLSRTVSRGMRGDRQSCRLEFRVE